MWEYRHTDDYQNDDTYYDKDMKYGILHKSDERKDHKYVARVSTGKLKKNKYRYFYDLSKYRAYLKSKQNNVGGMFSNIFGKKINKTTITSKSSNNLKVNKTVKTINISKDTVTNKGSKKKNKINKLNSLLSKGKKLLDKALKKATTTVDKISDDSVAKGKEVSDKFFKKLDTKVNSSTNKKKNEVVGPTKIDMPVRFDKNGLAYTKLADGKYKFFGSNKDEYMDYLNRLKYQKSEPDFMKNVPKISITDAFFKKQDMEKVNETYDPWDDNSSANCSNCSAAYELRRRGYDVEARLRNEGNYNGRGDRFFDYFEGVEKLGIYSDGRTIMRTEECLRKMWSDEGMTHSDFKNNYTKEYYFSETKHTYTADVIEKAITGNSPPGSRGMIDVVWNSGGGHSIVYDVDTKGKVTIRDAQTYDVYGLDELASRVSRVEFVRTDHLELKEGILNAVDPNEDGERRYYKDKRKNKKY